MNLQRFHHRHNHTLAQYLWAESRAQRVRYYYIVFHLFFCVCSRSRSTLYSMFFFGRKEKRMVRAFVYRSGWWWRWWWWWWRENANSVRLSSSVGAATTMPWFTRDSSLWSLFIVFALKVWREVYARQLITLCKALFFKIIIFELLAIGPPQLLDM